MKVAPYHSKRPGTQRYHNNDKCTEGNNIETGNKEPCSTRDGHTLCDTCKDLK